MISERSCDTKDWCSDAENSVLHHRNKLHFKNIYSNQNQLFKIVKNISQYYFLFSVFHQINAAVLSINDFFRIFVVVWNLLNFLPFSFYNSTWFIVFDLTFIDGVLIGASCSVRAHACFLRSGLCHFFIPCQALLYILFFCGKKDKNYKHIKLWCKT